MLRLDVGDSIESIVERLNTWQPDVLATYASMAGILAEQQVAGALRITPRRVVSSAEVLSPALRRRIQDVWGDIVFNQYGASEGGTFAVECESPYTGFNHDPHATKRGLHVFEDLVIFEVVDAQNQPVAPGEYGDKVLLTVLYNHTQPLIRYELSDRVRLATSPCSCGRALFQIDDIQGRAEDVLRFPNRAGGEAAVHPMVFYRILDATPADSWQVIQTEDNALVLRLRGDARRIDESFLLASVAEALERQSAFHAGITVEWQSDTVRGPTGKAARILARHRI